MPEQCVITGTINSPDGVDRAGVKVQAFDRNLPSLERRSGMFPQILGEAITDSEGRFNITYTLEEIRRVDGATRPLRRLSKQGADLSFRAFDRTGRELSIGNIQALDRSFTPEQIIFNAPAELEVSIVIESDRAAGESEYENLVAMLVPVVEDVPLADLTDDDVIFLLHELGIEQRIGQQRRIQWLRRSALLARQTSLPIEVFYGWGSIDIPAAFVELAETPLTDLQTLFTKLLSETDDRLRSGLQTAINEKVIPDQSDRIDEIMTQIERLKVHRGFLIPRRFVARLINESSGEPLPGLTVQGFKQDGERGRKEVGQSRSNDQGVFSLIYLAPPNFVNGESNQTNHRIQLQVLIDPETHQRFETDVQASDEQKILDVRVPIPASQESIAHQLTNLGSSQPLKLPPGLLPFLANKNINTLADIGKLGDIGRLEGLPIDATDPSLRLLEAHVDLSGISPDVQLNAAMIDNGYDSLAAIAKASRPDFVTALADQVGDFNAAQLQVAARAQTDFLNNVMFAEAADQANGLGDDADDTQRTLCQCRDCESAVSPLAYLADLLKYATERIKYKGAAITADDLSNFFYQRFNLSADCTASDNQVKQIRLCVEALRRFSVINPQAEKEYLLAAYTSLLNKIGASFEEIRLARNSAPSIRQSLATRLGIKVFHLDDLFLDPDADPPVLTEKRLEQLFGLSSTRTDSLTPIPPAELQTWRLDYLKAIWMAEDAPKNVYEKRANRENWVSLPRLPDGVVLRRPMSYDVNLQQLKCQEVMNEFTRKSHLALSSDPLYQQAVKDLFHISQRLPAVDPDLIGPDDFRRPFLLEFGGHGAFDLWKKRRDWVDDRLRMFAQLTKPIQINGRTEEIPDIAAMFKAMYQPVHYGETSVVAWASTTPPTDFESLSDGLKQGVNVEAVKFRLKDELNLTVDSFSRLMAIATKAREWENDHRSEKVRSEEWSEVYSILAQAQKIKLFPAWFEEEDDDEDLALRMFWVPIIPLLFWIPLHPCEEGAWPPDLQAGRPMIDPAELKLRDMPDPVAGEKAISLWRARHARLEQISKDLAKEHQTNGFDAMLRHAIGHPAPGNELEHDLTTLKAELGSPVPAIVDGATKKITEDLHLTVESFKRLLAIKANNDNPDPAKKPTPAEWSELYAMLTTARKIKHEFPNWVTQEQDPQTGVFYWNALKAKLPRWRASLEARRAWQQALDNYMRPPVIDSDLLGPNDFKTLSPKNPLFFAWKARKRATNDRLDRLKGRPKTLAGLEVNFQEIIDLNVAQFLGIAAEQETGNSIVNQVAQLSLELVEFNYLLRISKLAVGAQRILDSEWENACSILLQVWRRRSDNYFQQQSEDHEFFFSPDLFQIASPTSTLFQPKETSVVETWRAPKAVAYQEWQDKLQSRIDQQQAVMQGLREAVSGAEEAALPKLRDALLLAADIPGDLEAKAKWVTENLHIDAKMSGCSMTTRVAQAIETLQGILYAMRAGQYNYASDRIAVFARGLDNQVLHKAWDGTQWSPSVTDWESLGGSFKNQLCAVSRGPNRIHVFGLGADKRIFHKAWDGTQWLPSVADWESLGGQSNNPPSAVSWGPDRVNVFGLGLDNQLFHKTWDGTQWSPSVTDWEPLGGKFFFTPSVVSWGPNRIDIFGRDFDFQLLHKAWDGSQWRPSVTDWEPLGRANSEPIAISWGPNRLDIFQIGPDFQLQHKAWNGSQWLPSVTDWESLGGDFNRLPSVVSRGPNRLDIFGLGPDNKMLHKTWDGSRWLPSVTDWEPLGGAFPFLPDTENNEPSAVSLGANRLDVFGIGPDNKMLHKTWDGARWLPPATDWESLGGGIKNQPSAVSWGHLPSLTLQADKFDEEWKWIGSYATWRAAMFVFLYPENILHPSLRKWQTPAFESLVSKLRSTRSLTPADAQELAKSYAQYFQDVCTFRVEATCTSKTRIDGVYRPLFYMFGRGDVTGNVYWSTYDEQDGSGHAQTFWTPVTGPNGAPIKDWDDIVEIVGATPYQITPAKRYVYLFARKREGAQLICARYDLERRYWLEEVIKLDTLFSESVTNAAVKQQLSENEPPQVAFCDTVPYVRQLNRSGDQWAHNEFNSSFDILEGGAAKVEAILPTNSGGFYLIVSYPGGSETECRLYLPRGASRPAIISPQPSSHYKVVARVIFSGRAYQGSGTIDGNDIYLYLNAPGFVYVDQCRVSDVGTQELNTTTSSYPMSSVSDIPRVAPTAGALATSRVVIQKGTATFISSLPTSFVSEPGWGITVIRILPIVTTLFGIYGRLSSQDLQNRKIVIQDNYIKNQIGPDSNLTYLEEAYYSAPIQIALSLQKSGEYLAALDWFRLVYDYTNDESVRKIYYGLVAEESRTETYKHGPSWLLDPMNPHLIAATRQNAHTRFTILAIIQCLLDFADSEFTQDTAESNSRARQLYLTALELFDAKEIRASSSQCDRVLGILDHIPVHDDRWLNEIQTLKQELKTVPDLQALRPIVNQIHQALLSNEPFEARFERAYDILNQGKASAPSTPHLTTIIERASKLRPAMQRKEDHSLTAALNSLSAFAKEDFQQATTAATGLSANQLTRRELRLPWLRNAMPLVINSGGVKTETSAISALNESLIENSEPDDIATLVREGKLEHMSAVNLSMRVQAVHTPRLFSDFCVPPNPLLKSLRMRAELNLAKLRTCRNIAGLKRQLEPYAAPTDTVTGLPTTGAGGQLILPGVVRQQPTLYRYPVLIERAKQLVQLAGQIEAAMLSALAQRDAEAYNLLKARHDMSLAQASVRLQSLRMTEAKDGVTLAALQKKRSENQLRTYQAWIEAGLIEYEKQMIEAYGIAAAAQKGATEASRNIQLKQSAISSMQLVAQLAQAGPYGAVAGLAAGISNFEIDALLFTNFSDETKKAIDYTAAAQIASVNASFERRKQEWELQELLTKDDIAIGEQQITLANDRVRIVAEEQLIAELQTGNAKDTIEFLTTKFTNVELFDWMSGILERVYRFFLQQAAAMAKLAQNQLAFERQEVPPSYIQTDYWNAPSGGAADSNATPQGPDRKGLTGSARLLQDIYQLDQYAFDTNKRKLALTKTISLARHAPVEFQRFLETGVMNFATPMQMFDRGFPGHYLRLIKRVRTSIIALVPPMQGVHATLSTTGPSRVVIGGDVFQTVPIQRSPELIALSAPSASTGLFELDSQSDLLFPFEGSGVEMNWEFKMPKAANLFDYGAIADVLITLEYTALNSFDYRQQVIQSLPRTVSADRPFSFRNQFTDQWYDLHNPEQTSTPMTVRFTTLREDFPPNIEALKIQHVLLYFVRSSATSVEVPVSHLRYTAQDQSWTVGGSATSIDGVISTRRGNAGSWTSTIGKSPVGEWELALQNTEEIRDRFAKEDIEDILLVISYSGRTPEWPA